MFNDNQLNTPVLLMIFNRPETSDVTFEAIRKVKPRKLFIAGDGPRKDQPDDVERCRLAREIVKKVDWPCELKTLFQETNLGCFLGSVTAISWMLKNEECGMIFDDDLIPEPSFFYFCQELLELYKDDRRITHISGDNFLRNKIALNESYYFSMVPHGWGWATWRRAWNLFDGKIQRWPEIKKQGTLIPYFKNHGAYEYWSNLWDRCYVNEIDDWDAKWFFACAINNGMCINPAVNLVSNIGFGKNATHAKGFTWRSNLPTHPMVFPLSHPQDIAAYRRADDLSFRDVFNVDRKLIYRLLRPIKIIAPDFYQTLRTLFRRG